MADVSDRDTGDGPHQARDWGEYYRWNAAGYAQIADMQAAALDRFAGMLEVGGPRVAYGDGLAPFVESMRETEQQARLLSEVCAGWALAYDDLMARGGPSNYAALSAWHAASDWYMALLGDGRF